MKRSAIKRRPLADTVLDSLEPETSEYRERDGDGLYFRVKPDGSKSWQLRYKNAESKWSWLGVGGYPEVSGALARKRAGELREQIANGIDPLKERQEAKRAAEESEKKRFRVVADQWLETKILQGIVAIDAIRTYLDKDIYPAIGDKQLDDITRGDCAGIQAGIEAREAFTSAKKVRGWLNEIFGYAIAKGLTENDPASRLASIAQKIPESKQHPHLLEPELPDFIRALRASGSRKTCLTAAWLCLWTASRPGVVQLAEWSEFDLEDALWYIPAVKMKKRRDHLAPLPRQAVAALKELQLLTGKSRWLFPGIGWRNPTICENAICGVYARVGYKHRLVGHGTRHTASTLLNEYGWNEKWVDAQLSHKVKGVQGVYNKALYLEKRREMMQWYADHLDALGDGKVIPSVGHRRIAKD